MGDGGENPKVYRETMRDLIADRFDAVWTAIPAAVEGVDPSGVKNVRVASRRLRAAMDVADGCFPQSWFKPLHETAKAITGSLGEVRDREVLLEFLAAERLSAPPTDVPGIDRLTGRVEDELVIARASMLEFLGSIERRGTVRQFARRFGASAAERDEKKANS